MTTQQQEDLRRLEESLFFNKERILRWTRKSTVNAGAHPQLEAYEAIQKEKQRQSIIRKVFRIFFSAKAKA